MDEKTFDQHDARGGRWRCCGSGAGGEERAAVCAEGDGECAVCEGFAGLGAGGVGKGVGEEYEDGLREREGGAEREEG